MSIDTVGVPKKRLVLLACCGAFLLMGVATVSNGASSSIAVEAPCVPVGLTANADIVLLGMPGGGGAPSAYRLPHSQHAANVVAVGGRLRKPTFLVLAAHESTIWDFSGLTGGPIRGVYVSGLYGQGVSGLPTDTPVFLRHWTGTREDDRSDPCPDLGSPDDRPDAMLAAVRIRRAFGRGPVEFYGSYMPFSFGIHMEGVPPEAEIPPLEAVRAEGSAVIDDKAAERLAAWAKGSRTPLSKQARDAETSEERRRQRLLHIRWNATGDIVDIQREDDGGDS